MRRWSPTPSRSGSVIQGAVPTGRPEVRANGLLVRGVVTTVYTYGDRPFLNQDTEGNAVYVDVLLYGRHNQVLPRVLWTDPVAGLHEGPVTLPRATTLEIDGDLNPETSKPQSMDGHHVIVGFLEDDLAQPFVLACFRHPSSDVGNASKPLGQRMRLTSGDPVPAFWKHRGSFFGINGDGDFVLDTTQAHSGAYEANGNEPAPTDNGTNGNVLVDLQPGGTITVKHGANITLTITESAGSIQVQNSGDTQLDTDGAVGLGTGAAHPLIYGDIFQAQQAAKNQAVIAAMTALVGTLGTAVGTLSSPPAASQPVTGSVLAPLLTAIQTAAQAVQQAFTSYDASVQSHLSPDVSTK